MATRTKSARKRASGRRKPATATKPKPATKELPVGLVPLGTQSYYLRNTYRQRYLSEATHPKADLDKQYGDTGLIVHGQDKAGRIILREDHRSGDAAKAKFFSLTPGAVLEGGRLVEDKPIQVELYLMDTYMQKVPKELLVPMVSGVSLDYCLSSAGGTFRGTNYVFVGDPGIGKSTIVMEFAAAQHALGKKVLRIEAEMTRIDMVGYVARFPQFGKIPTLFLADYPDADPRKVIEEVLKEGWDIVVIDSVTELTEDLQESVNLTQKQAESFVIDTMVRHNEGHNDAGTYTAFLVISQVGKGGRFVGSNKWKHNTTGMIEFRNGKRGETYAFVEKNRRGFRFRRLVFEIQGSAVVYRVDLAEAEEMAKEAERQQKERIDESNSDFMKRFLEGTKVRSKAKADAIDDGDADNDNEDRDE